MATGLFSLSLGATAASAATSWSAVNPPLPTAASSSNITEFQGGACSNAGFCLADGFYSPVDGSTTDFIDEYVGGEWSSVSPPAPNDASTFGFGWISCAPDGSCEVIGSDVDDSGAESLFVDTLADGAWTLALLPNPASLPADATDESASSIDCITAQSCVVLASVYDPSESSGMFDVLFTETETNGVWSPAIAPLPAGPSGAPNAIWSALSCGAEGSCVAIGATYQANGIGDFTSFVDALSDGSWTSSLLPVPPGDTAPGPPPSLDCPSADFCVATGYGGALGDSLGYIDTYSNGAWSVANEALPSGYQGALVDVSCSSTTSCVAVGWESDSGPTTSVVDTYSNGQWTVASTPSLESSELWSVACPANGQCVAVGYARSDSGTQGFESELDNGAWTSTPSPSVAPNIDLEPVLVSCGTSNTCVALANATAINPEGNGAPTSGVLLTLNAGVPSTTTAVSVSPSTPTFASPTTLTATVTSSDGGGTVMFSVDGTPLGDCLTQPLVDDDGTWKATCVTSTLPAPGATVSTYYTGDAASAESQDSLLVSVSRASQVITFTSTAPDDAVVGGAVYTVAATSSSALGVTFTSSTSAVCTVNTTGTDNQVSFVGAGTCTIDADQGGDVDYSPALTATQSLDVGQGSQAIEFSTPPAYVLLASGSSYVGVQGGPSTSPVIVSSGSPDVCSVTPTDSATLYLVTYETVGTCTIDATQAGDANYTAAPADSESFPIYVATQAITFTSSVPEWPVLGTGPYIVTATGGPSGNPVEFSSATPTVCGVTGDAVSYLTTGLCIINANQAGTVQYAPAPTLSQEFTITDKIAQTVDLSAALPSTPTVGGTYTLRALSSTAATFSSATPAVCSVTTTPISGPFASYTYGTVTDIGVGTCTVEAQAEGNAYFLQSPTATESFEVHPSTPTVAITAATSVAYGNEATLKLSATLTGVGGLVPTGSVTFIDQFGGVLCQATVSVRATASCTPTNSQLAPGSYRVVAAFTPSSSLFAKSASPPSALSVVRGTTTMTPSAAVASSTSSQWTVTLRATLTDAQTHGGVAGQLVSFTTNGTRSFTCVATTNSKGVAACVVSGTGRFSKEKMTKFSATFTRTTDYLGSTATASVKS